VSSLRAEESQGNLRIVDVPAEIRNGMFLITVRVAETPYMEIAK
jgi:hypothetical protein